MRISEDVRRRIVNIHPTKLFEPADHVIPNDRGDPYLSVTDKRLWFRAVYPDGVIRKEIEDFTESYARVHVRVYTSRDDNEDHFISEGYASRTYKNEAYKEYYLEEAFRAAVRVALTEAGFATGFAEAEGAPEDGENYPISSRPMPVSVPLVSIPTIQPAEETQSARSRPVSSVISPANGISLGVEPKKSEIPIVGMEPEMPVMTLEEALNVKSKMRNTYGRSLRELIEESKDPEKWLMWIVNEYPGPDNQIRQAASVILEEMKKRRDQAA